MTDDRFSHFSKKTMSVLVAYSVVEIRFFFSLFVCTQHSQGVPSGRGRAVPARDGNRSGVGVLSLLIRMPYETQKLILDVRFINSRKRKKEKKKKKGEPINHHHHYTNNSTRMKV